MEEIFRYFEFAEEKDRGKPEKTTEMSCDALSVSPGIPDKPIMIYSGGMGRGKTIHRPGFYTTNPSFEIGTDLQILTRLLYFALGEQKNITTEQEKTSKTIPRLILQYQKELNTFTEPQKNINIPGHSKTEKDNYLAIGHSKTFNKISFKVKTARTDNSIINYEYWNGKEWADLPIASGWIHSGNTSNKFQKEGEHTISLEKPVDWQKRSLDSKEELYFIRVRCTQFNIEGNQGQIQDIEVITTDLTKKQYIYSSNKILLPSFTGFFGIDLQEFQIPGLILDKLELSVENEFIMLKGDMQGGKELLAPIKKENELKMNPDYPLAFYEANLHMRDRHSNQEWDKSTLISPDIKKFNLSISNSAKSDDGQGLGSRFPYKIPVGERTIELSFDYEYLTTKWYDLMQGGPDGPQENRDSTEFELMLEFNAGIYGNAQFYFPRVIITSAGVDSKGRDPITQSISLDAYMDTTEIPTNPPTKINTDIIYTYTA